MTRDYRASKAAREHGRARSGGGTILGIFIGLILGLGIAAGVFYYVSRSPSPFHSQPAAAAKNGASPGQNGAPAGTSAGDKPRFDFYKILPGTEDKSGGERKQTEPKGGEGKAPDANKAPEGKAPDASKAADAKTQKAAEPKVAEGKSAEGKPAEGKPAEQFFLQIGSYANAADAENEKARLALLGYEAFVQTATLADKGQRFRVRVGPFGSSEEMNRNKAELSKRGVEANVIRNP